MTASGLRSSGLALALVVMTATSDAGAGPVAPPATTSASSSMVLKVHDYHDDWHPYRRRYARSTYVRAPFTRVETRGYRATAVDAPFVSVRVGRRGTWVRAPFVDLFSPRD